MEKVAVKNKVIEHTSDKHGANTSSQNNDKTTEHITSPIVDCGKTIKAEIKEDINVEFDDPLGFHCEKPFVCDICNKSYARKVHLNRHKKRHSAEKPFQCARCSKSFVRKDYLREHEKNHSGERPYQCEVCKKTYKRKFHLKQHGRYHSGEKPFQCSLCDKSFAYKSDLVKHTRIHSGDKPFKCDTCNKVFATSSNLASHRRTHSGEKQYQCHICKKCFSRKYNREKHERIHAREKQFPRDHTLSSFLQSLQTLSEPVTYQDFYFCFDTCPITRTTSQLTLTKILEPITIFSCNEQLFQYLNLGWCKTKYMGYYTHIPTLKFILFSLYS